MAKLWRHIEGRRGVSRVRVYERTAGGPLHVEWYRDGQRFQRSLKTVTGDVIIDRRQAVAIAQRMAAALERGHNQRTAERNFGFSTNRTLGQLLTRLHEDKGPQWSDGYVRDQDRYRDFWVEKVGGGTQLTAVNAAMVESVARRESSARSWSDRTHGAYLRYLVDAFYYAERKLKWIEQRHNLSAVAIPSPNSKGRAYSKEEIRRLLPALESLGTVPGWAGHMAWQTGRRRNAIFTLPKSAVAMEADRAVVRWPEETDKAGKEGVSVVVGRAYNLLKALMDGEGPFVVGKEPPSEEQRGDWMNEAERVAGVQHVRGRSWHGIKRRWANRTDGMKGRSAQAGTREDTLQRVYDPKDDLDAAEAIARKLADEVD